MIMAPRALPIAYHRQEGPVSELGDPEAIAKCLGFEKVRVEMQETLGGYERTNVGEYFWDLERVAPHC